MNICIIIYVTAEFFFICRNIIDIAMFNIAHFLSISIAIVQCRESRPLMVIYKMRNNAAC